MKFTANKSDLQSGVNIAIRAVPSHTTMPILECILIEARTGDLVLTSNDMEMGIETHVKAGVEERGLIAVEAKMFSEIVRKLPDEIVTFESDIHDRITISSGKAKFAISGRSGEEFTALPSVDMDDCVTLSQHTLKSLIQETIFAVANSENSKVMNGELFEIRRDIFRVVALDGHRIAIRTVALKESFEDKKVIVPGKALQDISRIISGEMDEIVRLYFSKNHIIFEIPGTRVVSRLIDGEFYNVDQMISNDFETKIVVNRMSFLSCADRATLFVREGDKKPIVFEAEDQELHLSIESPLGSMNETLEILKEGRDIIIGFNPRLMIDALRAISDEEITIYLMNPKAPCFIRDEGMSYTYLILPVNFVH